MPLEKLNDGQIEILLDFVQKYPHLCFGRLLRRNHTTYIKKWNKFCQDMNRAGDGAQGDFNHWKKYWSDLKMRVRIKIAQAKGKSKSTGLPFKLKLEPYEKCIMDLMDEWAGSQETTRNAESINAKTTIKFERYSDPMNPHVVLSPMPTELGTEEGDTNQRVEKEKKRRREKKQEKNEKLSNHEKDSTQEMDSNEETRERDSCHEKEDKDLNKKSKENKSIEIDLCQERDMNQEMDVNLSRDGEPSPRSVPDALFALARASESIAEALRELSKNIKNH